MKSTLLAIALSASVFTTGAMAGGLEAPVMEQVIIEQETASSAGGYIVPLILLLLVAAAVTTTTGGGGGGASDMRLKTNIDQVGISPSGLPIYNFSYIGSSTVYQGTMAQDVLTHTPDAVFYGPFGYMGVFYDMVDVEMKKLN